jgi:hypothetical protein
VDAKSLAVLEGVAMVTELIHQYSTLLAAADGERYVVRAYAGRQPRGLWEAWFVFIPLSGGNPLVTEPETTQSKRPDVVYWASGISRLYLQGALGRASEKPHELARFITQAGSRVNVQRAAGRLPRDRRPASTARRPTTRLLCLRGCAFQRSYRRGLSLLQACPYLPNVVCPLIRVPLPT